MPRALRRLGFADVTHLVDLSKQETERALIDFAERDQGADWAVVYFAGHGVEMNGVNYLI
ncbi:MAG: caspase family protein [Propylenella sp.]